VKWRARCCCAVADGDGIAMMVVEFPASCAAAMAAERGCRGAMEVHCVAVAACANGARRGGRRNRCQRWCEIATGWWCVAVVDEKMAAAAAMVLEGEEKIRVRVSLW